MKPMTVGLALALLLATAGCSNMNSTEQRMLSGGAIGAGAGAVVGALTRGRGNATGAAIRAPARTPTRYIKDHSAD